jgi:hypothetical protein
VLPSFNVAMTGRGGWSTWTCSRLSDAATCRRTRAIGETSSPILSAALWAEVRRTGMAESATAFLTV